MARGHHSGSSSSLRHHFLGSGSVGIRHATHTAAVRLDRLQLATIARRCPARRDLSQIWLVLCSGVREGHQGSRSDGRGTRPTDAQAELVRDHSASTIHRLDVRGEERPPLDELPDAEVPASDGLPAESGERRPQLRVRHPGGEPTPSVGSQWGSRLRCVRPIASLSG